MNDRFAPDWAKVKPAWEVLNSHMRNAEIVNSFCTIANPKERISSVDAVQRQMRTIIGLKIGIPWVFFDTVSELIKSAPIATTNSVVQSFKIETGNKYEYLRITPEGNWQIVWEIDSNPDLEIEYREIAIDWYKYTYHDLVPIVPQSIIDCIASCVILLRENLVLPAASVLSIAFETTLWDALIAAGIQRTSERIEYEDVTWSLSKKFTKFLLVAIEGADKQIADLNSSDGSDVKFGINMRRLQTGTNKKAVMLQLEVEKEFADFLSSTVEKKKEIIKDKGFSEAMQRARINDIAGVQYFPEDLDATLVPLRNNLIHLPSDGYLDQPIPIPGRSQIDTVDKLRNNPGFVKNLLFILAQVINSTYMGRLNSQDSQ